MLHRAEKKPSEAGFTGDVERAKRESRFSFQSRGAGKTGEAGFTLLLAALVGSIVLAIGSSIFVIAQKQLILSSIGRESQFAFYAADTGAECALYWDIRHDSFGAEGPSGVLRCDSQSLNVELIDGTWNDPSHAAQFEFDLFADLGQSERKCIVVTIIKATVHPFTTIHSDGHNTSCADLGTNVRSLQRSVELTY